MTAEVHGWAGCHMFARDAVGAAWESARRRRRKVLRLEYSKVKKAAYLPWVKSECTIRGTHWHGWVVMEAA